MNASSPVYYLPVFCGIDYCSLRSQQHASQSMSRDFGISNLSALLFIFILYFFPRLIIKFLFLKVIDSVFVCNLADYFTWISSYDVLSGISLDTTLPAPITTLLPTVTPGRITVFPPIHTLSPTVTGIPYSYPELRLSG